MFRLIDKKSNIIIYNYENLGIRIIPTKRSYKIVKNNKECSNDYILSVSVGKEDMDGKLLFTEDKINFSYNGIPFNFGVIKYKGRFIVETNDYKDLALDAITDIILNDEFNDSISGQYI